MTRERQEDKASGREGEWANGPDDDPKGPNHRVLRAQAGGPSAGVPCVGFVEVRVHRRHTSAGRRGDGRQAFSP